VKTGGICAVATYAERASARSVWQKRTIKITAAFMHYEARNIFAGKIAFQPGFRSRKESEVFGWSRIPNNTRCRIFSPTPDVQLDYFLHHTPKVEISVEMVQFLSKLLLKQISCCAPRFPLILTAKFHLRFVQESDILPPTPQPCFQRQQCQVAPI